MGHYDSKEACKVCNSYRCNCRPKETVSHKKGWLICPLTYKVSENEPFNNTGSFYDYCMQETYDEEKKAKDAANRMLNAEIEKLKYRLRLLESL